MVHLNQSAVGQEAFTPLLKDMQDCMVVSVSTARRGAWLGCGLLHVSFMYSLFIYFWWVWSL